MMPSQLGRSNEWLNLNGPSTMKIATLNINSIRNRRPRLLLGLADARPDVVCLQELRIHRDEFSAEALQDAGYGAIWQGQSPRYKGVGILVRGTTPLEVRRGLPGDTSDQHARYLEAAVNGVLVGCLYAPNTNPQSGPKFTYKLSWLARLEQHVNSLLVG
jgi:exodeoxyribonuclease-3